MRLFHIFLTPLSLCTLIGAQEIEELDCEFFPVVDFASEINVSYEIDVSRDGLENFEPLVTRMGNGERITHLDQVPRSPDCFYRVTANPVEVAPHSLDGVNLSITQNEGPTLSFIAGRGQEPGPDNPETGVLGYKIESEQRGFQLDELSASITDLGQGTDEEELLQMFLKWPDRISNGRYRYTRIDRSSGRLEFWGNIFHRSVKTTRQTTEDGFYVFEEAESVLSDGISSNPYLLTLSFQGGDSGNIVESDGLLQTSVTTGEADPSRVEVPLNLDATLAENEALPFAHSSDNQVEPSTLPDLLAAPWPLIFTDYGDGTSLSYDFRARVPEDGVEYQENGTFTCGYISGGSPASAEVTLSGDYEVVAIAGTDSLELILDYNEADAPAIFNDGTVLDGTTILDFGTMEYSRPSGVSSVIGSFSYEDDM
jgi:hypothetical protein